MSPPFDDELDRGAILARRAMFVTSALAVLSCSAPRDPATEESAAVASGAGASTGSGAPSATASGSAGPLAPAGKRSFAPIRELAPPLEVSDKLPPEERAALEDLQREIEPVYAKLAKAWESAPLDCSPEQPACDPRWQEVTRAMGEVSESLRRGPCHRPEGLAKTQRLEAHARFIREQLKTLEDELRGAARKYSAEAAFARYGALLQPPQPCLKCAMPEVRAQGAIDSGGSFILIGFADKDAKTPDAQALAELKKLLTDPKAKGPAVVRGHADPSEPDAEKLATARAEAVKAFLVKEGVPASRLTTKGYAAWLPIASPKTAEGRAANRRVDVDVSVGW